MFVSVAIDLTRRDFEDIYFVTNNFYCGRGFKLKFSRISCSPFPSTTLKTVTTPTADNCGREYKELKFDFEILKKPNCTVTVKAYSKVSIHE